MDRESAPSLALAPAPGLDLKAAYFEHAARLRSVLQRTGVSRADAEDLVSETFVIAHEKQDEFDGTRATFPWLAGIAFNRARNLRRRQWFRKLCALGLKDETPREDERDPERSMIESEDVDRVRRAIALLPEKKRMILVLREIENLSAKEVGEIVGLDANAVHSAMHHVRKDFLKKYRQLHFLEGVR